MKTTQELKYDLYALDTEYIAQTISAKEYSILAAELIQQIQASEKLDHLAKLWQEDQDRMMSCI